MAVFADARATRAGPPPQPVQGLRLVLAAHRPRAPRAAVATLMDPPDGYVTLTCPVCGHGYQTLQAAAVPFCSVACADAVQRAATPPPEPPHLFRAVRCSYCC